MNAEKKYAVFAGAQYYPCGGMSDLIGFASTLQEAEALFKQSKEEWWQIVDTATWERVDLEIE